MNANPVVVIFASRALLRMRKLPHVQAERVRVGMGSVEIHRNARDSLESKRSQTETLCGQRSHASDRLCSFKEVRLF